MSIDVMKQALEYLDSPASKLWPAGTQYKIITALRTAIAEAEKQEPGVRPCHVFNVKKTGPLTEWEPTSMALALPDGNHALYTIPPAAPVQDDLPAFIAGAFGVSRGTAYDLMREALKDAAPLQEKNT